ncbi:hypothetical protein evm_002702 [Chilo suppressalis]|nr:hypothetical protein evm_002702 [Chilo suppressalis]
MISQNTFLKRSWPMLIQCAEAHRKPRWLPVAKSKLYRIPKRPEVSEEERLELMRVNNNYKTQMRAIRRFYHEEMIKEKSTRDSASSEMSLRLEADEWERCVIINDKWNAQVAAEREERRKIQLAEMEELALAKMEAKDKELKERLEKAAEEVRRQKALCETFITPDKLEEAIDYALANPIDYNYAIDLHGKTYLGTTTSTNVLKDEKTSTAV